MRFLARLVLNGVAIVIAAWLLPGLHISGPFAGLVAGVILGFVNAIVRPVLFFLTLPLTLITLGLIIFVILASLIPTQICGSTQPHIRLHRGSGETGTHGTTRCAALAL